VIQSVGRLTVGAASAAAAVSDAISSTLESSHAETAGGDDENGRAGCRV